MVLRVVDSDLSGEETQIVLAPTDDLLILEGVTVSTTNSENPAVVTSGNTSKITIEGSIRGGYGIKGNAAEINIGSKGFLDSLFLASEGKNDHLKIVNNGVMSGGAPPWEALIFLGSVGGGLLEVTNNGTMTSQSRGAISTFGSYQIVVNNYGTINCSSSDAIDCSSSLDLDDSITNSGLIRGSLQLRGGDDLYDGRGGKVLTALGKPGLVSGGDGNDTLIGGEAGISFWGGEGNDTFVIDGWGNNPYEMSGEGTDRVMTRSDFALQLYTHIEVFTTSSSTGTSPIKLTGNAFSQEIVGNYGNNVIRDGGVSDDLLRGLSGNDTYQVYSSGTTIVESAAQGAADRIMAGVDYALGSGVHVEIMTTSGAAGTSGIDLTGNELKQSIFGNAGSNILDGKGGSDTLSGLGGEDFFAFSSALEPDNIDSIADFNAADDTVYLDQAIFAALTLGALSAAAFKDTSTGPSDADDRIIYNPATGNLAYDADGVGGVAAIKFANIANHAVLTAADFVVI
jgi:Ca2+-binding RTX toxin-like protein